MGLVTQVAKCPRVGHTHWHRTADDFCLAMYPKWDVYLGDNYLGTCEGLEVMPQGEIKKVETPAWVIRMEKATDAEGYKCSGFEANEVAKEWRNLNLQIKQYKARNEKLREELVNALPTTSSADECTEESSWVQEVTLQILRDAGETYNTFVNTLLTLTKDAETEEYAEAVRQDIRDITEGRLDALMNIITPEETE